MAAGPKLLMMDYDHLNSDHLLWGRQQELLCVKEA